MKSSPVDTYVTWIVVVVCIAVQCILGFVFAHKESMKVVKLALHQCGCNVWLPLAANSSIQEVGLC